MKHPIPDANTSTPGGLSGPTPSPSPEAGGRLPLAYFLAEEMDARGWTSVDVALRMAGDYSVNIFAFELGMSVHEDGLLWGDLLDQVAAAFDLSSEMLTVLDKQWRNNPKGRVAFLCPERLLASGGSFALAGGRR